MQQKDSTVNLERADALADFQRRKETAYCSFHPQLWCKHYRDGCLVFQNGFCPVYKEIKEKEAIARGRVIRRKWKKEFEEDG